MGGMILVTERLQAIRNAEAWFGDMHRRALLGRAWSALTQKRAQFVDFATVADDLDEKPAATELRAVSIKEIRGTTKPAHRTLFDTNFNPLQRRIRAHWEKIAVARALGEDFEPVELIQVGSVYFVQDGHYRISTARAIGLDYIDAHVTMYEWDEDECGEPGAPASVQSLTLATDSR